MVYFSRRPSEFRERGFGRKYRSRIDQSLPGVLRPISRLEDGDDLAPIGHSEHSPLPDSAKEDTQILAQFADTYLLHVAHDTTSIDPQLGPAIYRARCLERCLEVQDGGKSR